MADYDLIVIGAGPFGLIAAHTWLELHPSVSVMILESGPDLGYIKFLLLGSCWFLL